MASSCGFRYLCQYRQRQHGKIEHSRTPEHNVSILVESGATGPTGPAVTDVAALQPAAVTGPNPVTAPVTTLDAKTGTQAPADALKKPNPVKPNFAKFPPELQLLPNWVLWRYLPPKSSNGKWRKVPFQPTGKTASTTDRSTWSRFEECCAAYRQGVSEGIGFVFDGEVGPDGLCYCGVDFDACVCDGNVDSLALERIKRLGTYTEWSVSRTGF